MRWLEQKRGQSSRNTASPTINDKLNGTSTMLVKVTYLIVKFRYSTWLDIPNSIYIDSLKKAESMVQEARLRKST